MRIAIFSDLHAHAKRVGSCLEWQGYVRPNGYGMVGTPVEGARYAHRVAWLLVNGEIPEGQFVLHRCDNRRCIEPSHLFLGTHTDNMRDMANKGRQVFQQNPEKVARGPRHGHAKQPGAWPRGSSVGNAKLCESDIPRIRAMSEWGTPGAEIARKYNVSRGLIYHILKGRAWTHV